MTTEITEISAVQFDRTSRLDRDFFQRQIGRREMADAIGQMAQVFSLKTLAEIKKEKGYRNLKGLTVKSGSEQTLTGTWAEFCLYVVGSSADKVDLDLANYAAFGEEALEAMQRAGIGYRQLRDLRRLPEDEHAALIAAADGGDQDALIEVAEDLLTRKGRQITTLTADLDEAKKTLEVKEKLLADRNDELNRVRERLIMIQTDQAEREEALKLEVDGLVAEALRALKVNLAEGFKVLTETAAEAGGDGADQKRFMAKQIADIKAAVEGIQEQFGIPDKPDEVNDPVWARKDAHAAQEPEWLAEGATAKPPAPEGKKLRSVPAAETEEEQS
ncbi:MAG: hypothetical protein VB101_07155 [Rhodospirillaceae bacterium]|nr:hypothetical protein [Rhodospirillaceae bacterium]